MNTKDSQPQTRRFIHSAPRWVCLFAAMLILCDLAASEALGQKNCIEAYKDCSACRGDTSLGRNLIGISTNKEGKCVVTGPSGCKPTDPCASENLKACQRCLDGAGTEEKKTGLTISLDRPGAGQFFTQGDDFPTSGRVTRNSQGVAGADVKLDFSSPRNGTAVGALTRVTTDANGYFTWPGYFTADAAVGNWSLTVTGQIVSSNEKSIPVKRDFTVKKLELTEEQVSNNMRTIIELWKADPSIPNGIEQPFIEELWRPRGPKVNFREWRNPAYKPYTCSVLADKTLRFLNGLRFHPTDRPKRLLLGGVDYGPVTDGTGNIHVAVALYSHESDDWTSGYILEAWWEQKKEAWGGSTWNVMFLGTDPKNGLGNLGNFWKGEYPTSGGSGGGYYPNPERVPYDITGNPTTGGKRVAVLTYSPVEDLITDSNGRRIGRLPDGTFVKEIPDAEQAHAAFVDGTFVNFFVVPEGEYGVTIRGTGNGTFHLMTTSTTETMSYGEQPITAGQQVTFRLSSVNLRQPLTLADGRRVMPQSLGPDGSETAAGGGGPGGSVMPQGGAPSPGAVRPQPSSGIGGTWTAPTGDVIELIQNGNRITGSYRGILGTGEITGTFDGRNLSATIRPNQALLPVAVPLALTLMENGKLVGRLETPLASGQLVLSRIKP